MTNAIQSQQKLTGIKCLIKTIEYDTQQQLIEKLLMTNYIQERKQFIKHGKYFESYYISLPCQIDFQIDFQVAIIWNQNNDMPYDQLLNELNEPKEVEKYAFTKQELTEYQKTQQQYYIQPENLYLPFIIQKINKQEKEDYKKRSDNFIKEKDMQLLYKFKQLKNNKLYYCAFCHSIVKSNNERYAQDAANYINENITGTLKYKQQDYPYEQFKDFCFSQEDIDSRDGFYQLIKNNQQQQDTIQICYKNAMIGRSQLKSLQLILIIEMSIPDMQMYKNMCYEISLRGINVQHGRQNDLKINKQINIEYLRIVQAELEQFNQSQFKTIVGKLNGKEYLNNILGQLARFLQQFIQFLLITSNKKDVGETFQQQGQSYLSKHLIDYQQIKQNFKLQNQIAQQQHKCQIHENTNIFCAEEQAEKEYQEILTLFK